MKPLQPFRDSPLLALALVGVATLVVAGSAMLVATTLELRYRRDIDRIVFNRNWTLLREITARANTAHARRVALAVDPAPPTDAPYVVVSLRDRRLWYRQGGRVIFTARVAVGTGKTLIKSNGHEEYRFDTPRGRLVVQGKDGDPVWVPPDWHYLDEAKRRGLGLVHLVRGQRIPAPDGTVITVRGNDVVKRYPDGRTVPLEARDGREIVVAGNIIVPPYGTNQRKYKGMLGSRRLDLGDGYALHGTDDPASIGHAMRYGCVRLRNEDVDRLYRIVPVGTPVFIY